MRSVRPVARILCVRAPLTSAGAPCQGRRHYHSLILPSIMLKQHSKSIFHSFNSCNVICNVNTISQIKQYKHHCLVYCIYLSICLSRPIAIIWHLVVLKWSLTSKAPLICSIKISTTECLSHVDEKKTNILQNNAPWAGVKFSHKFIQVWVAGQIFFGDQKLQLGLSFIGSSFQRRGCRILVTVEKLFSHVAVDTAAAYNEYMFGKASLNCGISFVTVSKVECEDSFFWRKSAPTFNSASSVSDCSCRRSARGFTAAGCINAFDDVISDSTAPSKARLMPLNLAVMSPTTESSIEKYTCFMDIPVTHATISKY